MCAVRHAPRCLRQLFGYVPLLLALAASPLAAQRPEAVAEAALRKAPVWDGHNDVPIQLRGRYGNVIADFDFEDTTDTGSSDARGRVMHTDFARLAEGHVGAQFWSVYVSADLTEPQAAVATVEQIDVTKRLIARYPDRLALALTADDVERVKPDPALYLAALGALGAQAHEALAFEDSPNGALAATRAGIYCIVVPNSLTQQLAFDMANLRLASLAELPLAELLEGIDMIEATRVAI